MTASLDDKARSLLSATNFATVATVEPDGQPQLSPVWVKHDGDDVLFSTTVGRRKHVNISRDPRVTVCVFDQEDPYSYVEVRGTATMTEEGGRALIDEFAKKYRGLDTYPWDGPDAVRVVVRVTPHKVVQG
ncbi:MAG TPA: PPOX class F420-dependent oxidoreductase [Candidatus Angelobacter sp.]|nr:PPOX class F420-dependent oxidoreductase [Candidatus Angelobacter sp.]